MLAGGLFRHGRQPGKGHGEFAFVVFLIDEFAGGVVDVVLRVEVAVAAKVEQDGAR